MTFGGFSDGKVQTPMSEINVTPMVDVMLVLLVIFIITAPLFTHAIKLDLPDAQAAAAPEKPETISLAIDADGRIYWGKEAVSQADLDAMLSAAAQKKPQPELHLRADKATRYEAIARVMSAVQASGIAKMGFVTEPKPAEATVGAATVPATIPTVKK